MFFSKKNSCYWDEPFMSFFFSQRTLPMSPFLVGNKWWSTVAQKLPVFAPHLPAITTWDWWGSKLSKPPCGSLNDCCTGTVITGCQSSNTETFIFHCQLNGLQSVPRGCFEKSPAPLSLNRTNHREETEKRRVISVAAWFNQGHCQRHSWSYNIIHC